jgi:ppGpp synthetase/RelA/SpoT-type nucleotidyltranferase
MAMDDKARRFYASYLEQLDEWAAAASAAERYVGNVLGQSNFDLHLISARAKTPDSVLQKLRRKRYEDPEVEFTDRIGVRVITYYQRDVDAVADELRGAFLIDAERSPDKRVELALREFGYRSVHLLARVNLTGLEEPGLAMLGREWFEIQIRSVLEHAWAEIEHELVYKAGVSHAEDFRRRFSQLAATLEGVDGSFEILRRERHRLIGIRAEQYTEGHRFDDELDVAALLGFLESERPSGRSFRQAEASGEPFPPRIDAIGLDALREAGIDTATKLRARMVDSEFERLATDYASRIGVATAELSHLAVLLIAIASHTPALLVSDYPDLLEDNILRELLG